MISIGPATGDMQEKIDLRGGRPGRNGALSHFQQAPRSIPNF
jgi:hypothetical protein